MRLFSALTLTFLMLSNQIFIATAEAQSSGYAGSGSGNATLDIMNMGSGSQSSSGDEDTRERDVLKIQNSNSRLTLIHCKVKGPLKENEKTVHDCTVLRTISRDEILQFGEATDQSCRTNLSFDNEAMVFFLSFSAMMIAGPAVMMVSDMTTMMPAKRLLLTSTAVAAIIGAGVFIILRNVDFGNCHGLVADLMDRFYQKIDEKIPDGYESLMVVNDTILSALVAASK